MTHQERQLLIAPLIFEFHRRREFAQQGRNGLEIDVIENKGLLCLGHVQHVMHRVTALL
ncbi:Uncharacterised protein [Enterobacter cloacae]|nr:Uncharacterised protein [Enterobacter cloacae]